MKARAGEVQRKKRERYQTDPEYRIKTRIRNRIKHAIRKCSVRNSVKFDESIGCTIQELRLHIEKQFTEGMCWERIEEIHIDHIIPVKFFDLTNSDDLLRVNHYTNLRPLWKKDNLSRTTKDYQEAHQRLKCNQTKP